MKTAYLSVLLLLVAATPNGGVLDNDTDLDGDAVVSAVLVELPQNGALNFKPDGTFTYTPNPNFHGVDTFTYRPIDAAGIEGEPTLVTITVWAKGDPPQGVPDAYETDEDVPLVVPVPIADVGYGGDYLMAAKGSKVKATWTFAVTPGIYRVSATWPVIAGAASNTQYRVKADGKSFQDKRLDQRIAPDSFVADSVGWKDLRTLTAEKSIVVMLRENNCNGVVVADAVRIEQIEGPIRVVADVTSLVSR